MQAAAQGAVQEAVQGAAQEAVQGAVQAVVQAVVDKDSRVVQEAAPTGEMAPQWRRSVHTILFRNSLMPA